MTDVKNLIFGAGKAVMLNLLYNRWLALDKQRADLMGSGPDWDRIDELQITVRMDEIQSLIDIVKAQNAD